MSLSSAFKKGKAFLRTGSLSGPSEWNSVDTTKAREATSLFPKVDPAVDGEDCDHDCATCEVQLPKGWKIDETDQLYGHVNGWATHILVATGKTDWVRDVADEKGSVMEAVGQWLSKHDQPENGKLMLSASNLPLPDNHKADELAASLRPTTVFLLPSFTVIEDVTPASVPQLITSYISTAMTTTTPLHGHPSPSLPPPSDLPPQSQPSIVLDGEAREFPIHSSPHAAVILLCSQRTRDARCGQSAPLLKREFERHLRPLGLYRDMHDTRAGGVGIYFISHVGGHKYSANIMVYRRAGAFSSSSPSSLEQSKPATTTEHTNPSPDNNSTSTTADTENKETATRDAGASQCIWLARVRPEDCEGIIKFTVLQGKVVKPDRQLRGGFDREKGLVSW